MKKVKSLRPNWWRRRLFVKSLKAAYASDSIITDGYGNVIEWSDITNNHNHLVGFAKHIINNPQTTERK